MGKEDIVSDVIKLIKGTPHLVAVLSFACIGSVVFFFSGALFARIGKTDWFLAYRPYALTAALLSFVGVVVASIFSRYQHRKLRLRIEAAADDEKDVLRQFYRSGNAGLYISRVGHRRRCG